MAAKRAKAAVDYSEGKPHAHCGICRHFEAPHACKIVAGRIDADMWCELFAHRAAGKTLADGVL